MEEGIQKVDVFELSDLPQKSKYEYIINNYHVVREEFAYMKNGEAKITVWWIAPE